MCVRLFIASRCADGDPDGGRTKGTTRGESHRLPGERGHGRPEAARVDDPGQGGLLQGRRLLPSRAPSCRSCSTTWTPTASSGRSCSPRSTASRRPGPALRRGSAPIASPSAWAASTCCGRCRRSARSSRSCATTRWPTPSVGPELLGRRHVPAERRRLLPALHEVLRARPAAVRQHRHPRPADPGRGAEPDPPRPRLRPLPRAQAVHDPRRRPLVGHRDPADDQVPEPAAHDLGVVAQAPARVAAALHAHARQGPDPVRLGLPGAVDASAASARPRRSTCPTRSATPGSTATPRRSSSPTSDRPPRPS